LRYGPISPPSQAGESRHDALPAHAVHSPCMGNRGRARGARAADPASLGRSPPVTTHRRDTPAGAEPAPRLDSPRDHVGCHASRSMRPRICPKRLPVKSLSASCRVKYRVAGSASGPSEQVLDPPLQHLIGREPDGIPHASPLQRLVQRGERKGRVRSDDEGRLPTLVAWTKSNSGPESSRELSTRSAPKFAIIAARSGPPRVIAITSAPASLAS
jgi:hypothetical protein